MSYARARLWLGISAVGTTVVVSVVMLTTQLPKALFPTNETWHSSDVWAILGFVASFLALMAPFDVLGGFVLPRRYGRQEQSFGDFIRQWTRGVTIQSTLFVLTGLAILAAGRVSGIAGAIALITVVTLGYLAVQGLLARWMTNGVWESTSSQLDEAWPFLERWGFSKVNVEVIDHLDQGFTSGVVGYPRSETVIIPRRWLQVLSPQELAAAIARRSEAVATGSRLRGLLLAVIWVLFGFWLATLLPNAGVRSVAELVATCCGFTCWMFLGLLVLPSVSRAASYAIDRRVVSGGVPQKLLSETLGKLDVLQDDERQRNAWVERIFHPVPSVDNRLTLTDRRSRGAWHAARMSLFLSWSCLGLLSRAVHCNAGRPELWVMLPTD